MKKWNPHKLTPTNPWIFEQSVNRLLRIEWSMSPRCRLYAHYLALLWKIFLLQACTYKRKPFEALHSKLLLCHSISTLLAFFVLQINGKSYISILRLLLCAIHLLYIPDHSTFLRSNFILSSYASSNISPPFILNLFPVSFLVFFYY